MNLQEALAVFRPLGPLPGTTRTPARAGLLPVAGRVDVKEVWNLNERGPHADGLELPGQRMEREGLAGQLRLHALQTFPG